MELKGARRGSKKRIAPVLRLETRVRANTLEMHLELRRSQHTLHAARNLPRADRAHAHMSANQPVDISCDTGGYHGLGAPAAFLRRLKNETYSATLTGNSFRHERSQSQAHRGMRVVTASMHPPGIS